MIQVAELAVEKPVSDPQSIRPGAGEADRDASVASGQRHACCDSACKKDPSWGVIGVQEGPL